jgi:8-oxo-dGTP pyrophosphatase MutT (NUDIX family)
MPVRERKKVQEVPWGVGVMVYKNIPKKFNPRFEIVSCYMEHNGKILLLHRHDNKLEGNRWGVPAGKIDEGESELQAILREIKEETGQKIQSENLVYLTKVYVKYPEYHFIYHMFRTRLGRLPQVILSAREHKGYKWIEPKGALKLPLVKELGRCIRMSYEI